MNHNNKLSQIGLLYGLQIALAANADTLTVADYHPLTHHFAVKRIGQWI